MVSEEQGRAFAEEIGAVAYIETSARTGLNVAEPFETVVRSIRKSEEPEGEDSRSGLTGDHKKRRRCVVL